MRSLTLGLGSDADRTVTIYEDHTYTINYHANDQVSTRYEWRFVKDKLEFRVPHSDEVWVKYGYENPETNKVVEQMLLWVKELEFYDAVDSHLNS